MEGPSLFTKFIPLAVLRRSFLRYYESYGISNLTAILYIAGYLQKQAGQIHDNDTMYYYDKFGKYLDQLNRGALLLPQDHFVQWCIYCFV